MPNSSWGVGMRPVSNFDQIGMSLNVISNAPDETSCGRRDYKEGSAIFSEGIKKTVLD